MKLIFGFIGKSFLFLFALTIVSAMTFFVVGTYAMSYPIMRLSPRDRRVKAVIDLGVACMTTIRAYGLDRQFTPPTGDTGDTGNTENTGERGEVTLN